MKKIKLLTVISLVVMIVSCNEDDSFNMEQEEQQTDSDTGFFSPDVLKVGNEWVYWHYEIQNYNENPNEIVYTGEIDIVQVVGSGEYNGITYSIVNHRTFNSNGELEMDYTNRERITPSSHWVNFSENQNPENEEYGAVKHPGNDWNYVWIQNQDMEK